MVVLLKRSMFTLQNSETKCNYAVLIFSLISRGMTVSLSPNSLEVEHQSCKLEVLSSILSLGSLFCFRKFVRDRDPVLTAIRNSYDLSHVTKVAGDSMPVSKSCC